MTRTEIEACLTDAIAHRATLAVEITWLFERGELRTASQDMRLAKLREAFKMNAKLIAALDAMLGNPA